MGVSDANAVYGPNARFTHSPISVHVEAVANSQTALELFEHLPGYAFEIIGFEVYVVAVTTTSGATLNLLIDTVSVLTAVITPTAGAAVPGVINSDGTEYGSATAKVHIQTTTGVSGDMTSVTMQIWIRRRAADVS